MGHFKTPPALGSETTVYVLDTADMGHAEPDGSNEWEDDLNARLYNAPGDNMHSAPPPPRSSTPLIYSGLGQREALKVNHEVFFDHA